MTHRANLLTQELIISPDRYVFHMQTQKGLTGSACVFQRNHQNEQFEQRSPFHPFS